MKEKPAILIFNPGTVMGGAEIFVERLAFLLKDGAEFCVLCYHSRMQLELRAQGIRVLAPPLPHARWIRRPGKYLVSLFLVPWLVLRHRIRVIYLNGYQSSYLALVARLLGRLTVITPHHLPPGRWKRNWYRCTARWADCAVNVSDVISKEHMAILPRVRSVTVRPWIPVPSTRPVIRLPLTRTRLLFVGRLVQSKGLPVVLDAIRQLRDRVELTICGEGPCAEEYRAQAKGLPVNFVGFAPDLSSYYKEADIMVIPSLGPEGSCIVALEAMSWGVPCVMSDLPAYREVAEGGRSAMLVKPGDPSELARAFSALIENPALGASLSAYARDMISTRYSPEIARLTLCDALGIKETTL